MCRLAAPGYCGSSRAAGSAQPPMALMVHEVPRRTAAVRDPRRGAAGLRAVHEKEREPGAAHQQSDNTNRYADEYQ